MRVSMWRAQLFQPSPDAASGRPTPIREAARDDRGVGPDRYDVAVGWVREDARRVPRRDPTVPEDSDLVSDGLSSAYHLGDIQMNARIRNSKKGFTLVEILIVVIILGILAAIVIPQFTNASQDARKSAVASTVQTLRSQIELYKLQHGDTLPDLVTDWTPFTGITQWPVGSTNNFGPYMQDASENGLTSSQTVVDGT